jgi:hypothetical protein
MFIELTNGSNDNKNEKIMFSVKGIIIKPHSKGCEICYCYSPNDIVMVQESYEEIKRLLEYSEALKTQGYSIVSKEAIENMKGNTNAEAVGVA